MFFVPRRQIRTQQPQGLVRIDWGNPITMGLEVAWYPGCGFGTVNGVGPHGRLGALGMTLPLDVSDRVRKGTLVSQQTRVNTNLVTYAPILGLHRESPTYTQKQFLLRGTWATTSYQSLLLGSYGNNSGNVNGALPTVGAYRQHALSWDLTGASPSVAEYLDLGAGGTFTPYGTWPWPAGLQRNVSVGNYGVGVLATYGFLFSRRLGLAELASLDENPWQIFAPHETRIFVPVSAGGGSVNANASGALSAVAVTAPSASASGGASASGALATITIYSPTATASAGGSASASGSFAAISISPATATATATKSATASGSFAVVSLSAPTATASGTTAGGAVATGAPAQITISHAAAIAIGSAVASGGYQSIGITAPTGTASVGNGNATASGAWAAISITAPTAYASSGFIRAPAGRGPTVIQAGSYRPSNTGGRRY